MPERRPPAARAAELRAAQSRAGKSEDDAPVDRGQASLGQRAQAVETAIEQAIRRGEFDDLPGAGKPLPTIDTVRDPDWWIRRKIEREGLTGLGPPALMLKNEDASLRERLDRISSETAVREALEDFNHRVRRARMQLLGGPPVLTEYRDVDAELALWRERRAARASAVSQPAPEPARRSRWRVRRER